MKQLDLLPFISPLTGEQERALFELQQGSRDEALAFRVLVRRMADPNESIVDCGRALDVSRQGVYRAFRLLRERGIYDEPRRVYGPKGTNPTLEKCLSPRHVAGVFCPACRRHVQGDMHFGVCEEACCGAAPCITAREKRRQIENQNIQTHGGADSEIVGAPDRGE